LSTGELLIGGLRRKKNNCLPVTVYFSSYGVTQIYCSLASPCQHPAGTTLTNTQVCCLWLMVNREEVLVTAFKKKLHFILQGILLT
jgi:hypothetical protein